MRQLIGVSHPGKYNNKHTDYDSIFVRIQCHYNDY